MMTTCNRKVKYFLSTQIFATFKMIILTLLGKISKHFFFLTGRIDTNLLSQIISGKGNEEDSKGTL